MYQDCSSSVNLPKPAPSELSDGFVGSGNKNFWFLGQRLLLLSALGLAVFTVPNGVQIAFDAMADAYLAVAVFVAATLFLVLAAERGLKTDLGAWLDRHRAFQVPISTLLGALPGCGGAIIVVTQFTRGYLSFGSVVATLTATMGDAMFLFLARELHTALLVLGISIIAGVITGHLVDLIHVPNFLRPSNSSKKQSHMAPRSEARSIPSRLATFVWFLLMVPGFVFGVLLAVQIDVDAYFSRLVGFPLAVWLRLGGAILGLGMWLASDSDRSILIGETDNVSSVRRSISRSVISNTNFIMAWVIFAFVGYELLIALSGIDLRQVITVRGPVAPAIAIVVGFIPGCGPQIMFTALYLSGAFPLSAQFGNAIANDGDALFPAIAIASKAALVATLYTGVPAVIVAYGWFPLFEWEP